VADLGISLRAIIRDPSCASLMKKRSPGIKEFVRTLVHSYTGGKHPLLPILKLYASFCVLHVVLKIVRSVWKRTRMLNVLRHVPRARYEDSFFGSIPTLLRHMHRRHDQTMEMTDGFPVAYHAGAKIAEGPIEVWVRDPACIKHFLKDNFENYTKSEKDLFWVHLRLWLGQGVFTASHGQGSSDKGRNWSRQRKIAASIFSRSNFKQNMSEVFTRKGQRLCELLRAPAVKGECVDMQLKFFQYTMDSIMQIFFGEASDTMAGQANEYASAYDTAHRCLVEFFLSSMIPLTLSELAPWPLGGLNGLNHKIFRNLHPGYREFKRAYAVLDSESHRIISSARKDPQLGQRKDLLALFLQSEGPSSDLSGPMSNEWLRDVVLNFIIAGRDTTACLLSWMFYIIASHPEVQEKMHEEIDAKVASGCRHWSFDTVSHKDLPYMHGVLYETLRLYPPVPVDGKTAIRDDVLPNGAEIPANTNLLFMPYAMGRDKKNYPSPEEVRPERWIPFKEPSSFEFPVFQAGPRICLGMHMAVFEAKIVAASLLQEFSFRLKAGEAEKITYLSTALTMSIINNKLPDGRLGGQESHNLWLIPSARK